MNEDLNADAIRARVELWRHFVSRHTVGDDVDVAQTPGNGRSHRPHATTQPGFPLAPGVSIHPAAAVAQPRSADDSGGVERAVQDRAQPTRYVTTGVAPPFRVHPVATPTGRRTSRPPMGRLRRRRVELVEVALWVLTAALVVAVSLLSTRAIP